MRIDGLTITSQQTRFSDRTGLPAFTIDNSSVAFGLYQGAKVRYSGGIMNAYGFEIDIQLRTTTSFRVLITNKGTQTLVF
jgi:hypothetical protein